MDGHAEGVRTVRDDKSFVGVVQAPQRPRGERFARVAVERFILTESARAPTGQDRAAEFYLLR